METKDFHIGDILSVTTGRLVSLCHIKGVYDILGWMTGESLYTHQLPRVSDEATPVILKMHPQLAGETGKEVTPDNWQTWLREAEAIYGSHLPIPKLTKDQHERIDPLSELAEKVHPDKIIQVRV